MDKIFAYGTPEEDDKYRSNSYINYAESIWEEKTDEKRFEKILPATKKVKLKTFDIKLSFGTLKVAAIIQNSDNSDKKDSQVEIAKFSHTLLKKAEESFASANFTLIEFSPYLKLDLGAEFFKINSDGEFDMLKASAKLSQTLSKSQVKETPFAEIADKIPESASLIVEIELELDLSIKEAKALSLLKVNEAQLDVLDNETKQIQKEIRELNAEKIKKQNAFIDKELKDIEFKDEKHKKKLIEKLEKKFNKQNKQIRESIDNLKDKLRKQKKIVKKLEQDARNISDSIKSKFLKKLNNSFIKKYGSLLTKIAKALDYIEIVFSVLKISIMLWSGAKMRLFKGESLSDISLSEISEILEQTMLDKILGKEIPEGDEFTTERPEAVYPNSGNLTEDENLEAIEAEYQNFLSLYGKLMGPYSSGSGTGIGGNLKHGNNSENSSGSDFSKKEEKEIEESEKKEGTKFGTRRKTEEDKIEADFLENSNEKVQVNKIRVLKIDYNSEFDGDKRVIGNKQITLNKNSVVNEEEVLFLMIFTAYFKEELCEFRAERIKAIVKIDVTNQEIYLIVKESVTCHFNGGKFCIKQGSSIKYGKI